MPMIVEDDEQQQGAEGLARQESDPADCPPKLVVILTANAHIGNQVASLMQRSDRQTLVTCSDVHVYKMILHNSVHSVVADIDDLSLSGLSVLALCKHHSPPISIYAICQGGSTGPMRLARDINCAGYFFLKQSNTKHLDGSYGMVLELGS